VGSQAPNLVTQDEEQLLRSWLAGNDTRDIARARRQTPGELTAQLVTLCGLDRDRARQMLRTGERPVPVRQAGPVSAPAPVALAEYNAWHCTACGYTGPAGEHRPLPGKVCPSTVFGEIVFGDTIPLVPVTVAILPRQVST
jgi:hypothetical protein